MLVLKTQHYILNSAKPVAFLEDCPNQNHFTTQWVVKYRISGYCEF